MDENDEDVCTTCGQRFELERRSFPTSIHDTYAAYCACTQKAQREAQKRFRPPTIGDILRSKVGR